MKTSNYSTPELKIRVFANEDVITSSSSDNVGGIPEGWNDIGGGF